MQGIVKLPFEDRHHQLAAVSTRRVLPEVPDEAMKYPDMRYVYHAFVASRSGCPVRRSPGLKKRRRRTANPGSG